MFYSVVSLAGLARIFPQPIEYESRVRNLQRFLKFPSSKPYESEDLCLSGYSQNFGPIAERPDLTQKVP